MPERDERDSSPTPGEELENLSEERLRSLFTAAYLPLEPSEALRQRVAAAAAAREAPAARRHRAWRAPLGWGAAFGAAAAVLLAVLALAFVRGHYRGIPTPSMAVNSHPALRTPERLAQAPTPRPLAPAPQGAASAGEGPAGAEGPFGVRQRAAALAPGGHEKSGDGSARGAGLEHTYREAGRYPGPAQKRQHAAALQKGGSRILSPLFPTRSLESPPSPSIGGGEQGVGARTSRDDLAFLNADPERVARQWAPLRQEEWQQIEARVRRSVKVKDDFVRIPFPRLASTSGRQIVAAVEEYKKEAAVVDSRLAREVTLACKGMALSDLCDLLHGQTGIAITAGRSVADEKVTVFCDKMPLRQVMRAINHLFGYTWLRSGKPGEFKYELEQDLRSQLLEEELRNRDRDAALVALDAQMQQYRPYLDEGFDRLEEQWEKAGKRLKLGTLSSLMMDGIWGAAELYFRLTPRDRAALMAGQELVFRAEAPDPDRRLPAEWQRPLLETWNTRISGKNGYSVRLADMPGVQVDQVRLRLNRSELGEVTLSSHVVAGWSEQGYHRSVSLDRKLATGQSPSVADPGNAVANAALRSHSPFDQVVSLRPEISCPTLKRAKAGHSGPQLYSISLGAGIEQPHVFSSDVWEAVHQASGLPIVADFYTHLYPLPKVTVEKETLFQTLCAAADTMGAHWRKDGQFLLGRSTSYFWDKLKEVPNRYLQCWAHDRDASGGLPLADFLEMASMSDQQLDSATVGEGIGHCWGLPEWWHVSAGPLGGPTLRPYARFLATLTPDQLRQAGEFAGLSFQQLTRSQQQAVMQLEYLSQAARDRDGYEPRPRSPEQIARSVISFIYVPSGWYEWVPTPSNPDHPYIGPLRPFGGQTAAEALAAARRIDPPVDPPPSPQQVQHSKYGDFTASINDIETHWRVRPAGG